jgi:tetratricopeptide (TPR) repeat protein
MTSIRTRIITVLMLIAPLVLAGASGIIKGKVTDPDGKPVKDVRITLRDEARGKTYIFKTDKNGAYFHMGIDPSEYVMRLEKAGYLTLEGKVYIVPEPELVRNAVLAPAVELPARPEWETSNLEANRLYQEGRYEDALKDYQEILDHNAELPQIQFNAGNCLFHLEKYEEAVTAFKEAVRLKPDLFEAYTNLANALGKLRRFEEEVPFFEQALAAYPENPALLSSTALLLLNSRQSDRAIEYLEKAASVDADAKSHFYSLGIAYTQKGDLAKAIEAYEKFLALNTDVNEAARVRTIVDQLKALLKN